MRFLFAAILSSLTVACGTNEARHISDDPYSAASAETSIASGAPTHSKLGWTKGVSITIATAMPERLVEATLNSIAAWNDAMGRDVVSYKGRLGADRTGTLYDTLDDDNTVIYYEKAWALTTAKPKTTLATTIWENDPYNRDAIAKGDIILNAQTYLFQNSMEPVVEGGRKSDIVDAETVLIHELGHLLGLDHTQPAEDADSVMHSHTYIGANVQKRVLSAGDIANIQTIYGVH